MVCYRTEKRIYVEISMTVEEAKQYRDIKLRSPSVITNPGPFAYSLEHGLAEVLDQALTE